MRRSAPRPALWCLLALLLPGSAGAQYMFLDTNGDGASTAADVVAPSGVTTLAVWVRTDANKDGSAAVCPTADGDLTISGYEFILRASNGTVSWGGFVNQIGAFGFVVPIASNDVDVHAGAYGSEQPPGAYLLARIDVAAATGTPRVDFAVETPLAGTYFTGFGSSCSGATGTNALLLGLDWFDTDGAAYGGVANHPPTIDPIPDLTVAEGDTLDQPLTARDADGEPLEFTKTAGPAFAAVTTVDPGSGVASGLLRLTPGYADSGNAVVSFQVADALAATGADARVRVLNRNRAPALEQPADMVAFTGRQTVQELHATDPDGGSLAFVLVSGPSYATVTTSESFSPAVGRIALFPDEWDLGPAIATVGVTDGEVTSERTLAISVIALNIGPPLFCRPHDMTIQAGTTVEQVLLASTSSGDPLSFTLVLGPGFVTVATESTDISPQTGRLRASPSLADVGDHSVTMRAAAAGRMSETTLRIRVVDRPVAPDGGDGAFTSTSRAYDVCHLPQSVTIADLDEDGVADVITGNLGCGVSVLRGLGGGRFGDRRTVRVDDEPRSTQAADFDGDGHLDVAVATSLGNRLIVLRGDGLGGLVPAASLPTGRNASFVAAGDLNHDGLPDLVSSNEIANTVSVFLGTGAFSFTPPATYAVGATPCFTRIADVNGDGHPELIEANEGSDAVAVLIGHGDGTFAPASLIQTADGPASVDVGDFNRDGHVDLVAAAFESRYLTVLYGDGTGSFSGRRDLETTSAPWSTIATDLNGDGRLDLVSANTVQGDVCAFIGHGDGTFDPAIRSTAGSFARYVSGADLSGDGRMDLVVANEGSGSVSVLFGNGDGTFGSARSIGVAGEPLEVSVGDLNGDGRADAVATLAETSSLEVRFGLGDGGFGPALALSPGATPARTRIADFDRDGTGDLVVAFEDSPVLSLYRGGATFGQAAPATTPTGGSAWSLETGDWNGDGAPDVALALRSPPAIELLDGDGAGGFTNRRDLPAPAPVLSLRAGDWDGDGVPDLASADLTRDVRILWGTGTTFDPGPTLTEESAIRDLGGGDLDRDGRDELIAMTQGFFGGEYLMVPQGDLAIYRWTSKVAAPVRSFYPAGAGGNDPHVADVTGDGRPDLLFLVEGSSAVGVLARLPDGTFGERADYGAGTFPLRAGIGDLNGDGRPDVVTADYSGSTLTVLLNTGSGGPPPLEARAFVPPEDRTLRLQSSKPYLCVRLEPVNGDFAILDLDPSSVRMRREGGSSDPIAPSVGKRLLIGDSDRNGVAEMALCFAKEDLRRLFADARDAETVAVAIEGSLADGAPIRAELALVVVGIAGGPLAAWIAPNPLNPAATLTFTTRREGRVRVELFDVRGRMAARILDEKRAAPGEHRIPIGDGAPRGGALASGVYFYRIEAPEGTAKGRFVVLK